MREITQFRSVQQGGRELLMVVITTQIIKIKSSYSALDWPQSNNRQSLTHSLTHSCRKPVLICMCMVYSPLRCSMVWYPLVEFPIVHITYPPSHILPLPPPPMSRPMCHRSGWEMRREVLPPPVHHTTPPHIEPTLYEFLHSQNTHIYMADIRLVTTIPPYKINYIKPQR